MHPKQDRPIVIKRGGPVREKPHGGAWKLAYADFMTAMMAFFLLMWLLGSVNGSKLDGIADYFKQPLKVSMLGGAKSSESSSILQGGGTDITRKVGEQKRVAGDKSHVDQTSNAASGQPVIAPAAVDQPLDQAAQSSAAAASSAGEAGSSDKQDEKNLQSLKSRIEQALMNNKVLNPFRNQILLDVTQYGLRIQIVDAQNRPMFATASAEVEPYMRAILRELGPVLNSVPNRVVLEGHTDAVIYAGGEKGYSNWELSTDRANSSRRELVAGGMDDAKVLRVIGLAATNPFNASNAYDPRNRRISVMVLNRRTEAQLEADHARPASLDSTTPPQQILNAE